MPSIRCQRSNRSRSAKVESSFGRCHSSDIQTPDVRRLLSVVPSIPWRNALRVAHYGCGHNISSTCVREVAVEKCKLQNTTFETPSLKTQTQTFTVIGLKPSGHTSRCRCGPRQRELRGPEKADYVTERRSLGLWPKRISGQVAEKSFHRTLRRGPKA
jgi:hypothetical protein